MFNRSSDGRIPTVAAAVLAATISGIPTAGRSVEHNSSGAGNPITVTELVRYATIGDPATLAWNDRPSADGVIPSPDGKSVAVVVRGGNPQTATNDASLLLFDMKDVRRGARGAEVRPQVLARFASATNYQPIALVRWLKDGKTLVFAGTKGDARSQVYRLNTRTGLTEELTQEIDQLAWFDITSTGDRLVTITEEPERPPADDPECKARGCLVTADKLLDAINGVSGGSAVLAVRDLPGTERTGIPNPETADPTILRCDDALYGSISPDGRYVLRRCALHDLPESWKQAMQTPGMRDCWDWKNADYCEARKLVITDLQTGTSVAVGEAPVRALPGPIWIDGGRAFILSGILERRAPASATTETLEQVAQTATLGVVLFDSRSLKATRIAELDQKAVAVNAASWDSRTKMLTVEAQQRASDGSDARLSALPAVYFRRSGNHWKAVSSRTAGTSRKANARIHLVIEQSLNDRPILVAFNSRSGAKWPVLDPNPWLAERKLGRVETVSWQADGRTWHGGLYFPQNYAAGRRYPLVIQTNGFAAERFSLDGRARSFAGRALAAHEIVVLQVAENYSDVAGTPAEWAAVRGGYEAAIDHLDDIGLIDRNRVGIQGWDRSGTHVGYALSHSSFPFAASALIDTGDFGLWWYLTMGEPSSVDGLFGGAPYGEALNSWFKDSPTFNMDRVRTPMFLWQSEGPIELWDWYSGLRRLDKPVEYWIAPDAVHDVFRVEQRTLANQLLIDWFLFWLKDEEDSDQAKADQYARWRQFREQQINSRVQNEGQHRAAP